MDVLDSGPIDGFVGYFDVQFRGSPEHPADVEVTRSCTPATCRGTQAAASPACADWRLGRSDAWHARVLPSGRAAAGRAWLADARPPARAGRQVLLSTAPDPTGATHWGQQTFSLNPVLEVAAGDAVAGDITIVRKKENHRLMEVAVAHRVLRAGQAAAGGEHARVSRYHIE